MTNAATAEEIVETPLTEEETKALDGESPENESEDDDAEMLDQAPTHDIPEWAILPPEVKLPPTGTVIAFMQIQPSWTTTPTGPSLQCVLWPLTESDELAAYKRSRGDQARSVIELAKGCIKVVNGERADWTNGKSSNVEKFWTKLGPKARHMVRNYYAKTHLVTAEEALDFFSNHFAAVTVQPK